MKVLLFFRAIKWTVKMEFSVKKEYEDMNPSDLYMATILFFHVLDWNVKMEFSVRKDG